MNLLEKELRILRGLLIALHVKEKSHNENIKNSSVDVREIHKQRDRLTDLYIEFTLRNYKRRLVLK
jgi:hypothetical protein